MQLWIADCNIENLSGHYFTYALSVTREAQRRGVTVRWLVHRRAVLPEPLPCEVRRVFRRRMADQTLALRSLNGLARLVVRPRPRPAQAAPSPARPGGAPAAARSLGLSARIAALDTQKISRRFQRDLQTGFGRELRPDDVVLLPTVRPRQALGVCRWLESIDADAAPRVAMMLRYGPASGTAASGSSDPLVDAMERCVRARPLHLVTDSRPIAEVYAAEGRLHVHHLPIPHTHLAADDGAGSADRTPVHFVALGDARQEKGFDVLVGAIRALADAGELADMHFTIQTSIAHRCHAPMRQWADRLRTVNRACVTIIDRVLSVDEYERVLRSADVVVLPYRRRVYTLRTSGPLVEALALGKPVIVTEDTWLAEQIRSNGAGLMVADGDVGSLTEAIRRTRRELDELRGKARAAAEDWRAFHNPANFLTMLLDVVS